MPISVQCPNCSAKLNAPDAAAGRRVKCPKCQTAVPIPAADPVEAAEVLDEPSPPPPVKRKPDPAADAAADEQPKKKSSKWEDDEADEKPKKKPRREDDEEDERPKKKSRRDDDADEDDRPKKRSRRDDGDDEDRPRSRRQRAGGGGVGKQLNVCGLIGLIVGIPSIILNFLACCGGWIPALVGGVVSLALGIIGLVLAKKSEGKMGGGLAIAGTSVGGVAVVFSLLWMALFAAYIATRPTAITFPTGSGFETPTGRGLEVPTNPTPNAGEVVKITAEELGKALDDDEAGTHAKYDGQTLEVTGTLADVTDLGGNFPATVSIDGVGADLKPGQVAQFAGVPIGGLVTVRGKYRKDQSPLLGDAVFVSSAKHPDGTDAKLDLLQLRIAYTSKRPNTPAADKKYKGKLLEVEVGVNKVNKGGPQGGTLEIIGDDPKAEARFAAKDAASFADLIESDFVKVRGKCAGMVNGVLVLEGCTLVK